MQSVHNLFGISDLWKTLFGSNESKNTDMKNAIASPTTSTYVADSTSKGSVLGWFSCAMAGNSFTMGSDYDWYNDKCSVKGVFRQMPHGR